MRPQGRPHSGLPLFVACIRPSSEADSAAEAALPAVGFLAPVSHLHAAQSAKQQEQVSADLGLDTQGTTNTTSALFVACIRPSSEA